MRVQIMNVGPDQEVALPAVSANLCKSAKIDDRSARPIVLHILDGTKEDLLTLQSMGMEIGEVEY